MQGLTADEYRRAERRLSRRDPVMRALIRRCGHCGLAKAQHTDPFAATVQAIVWQQLSGKAASTIYKRLQALWPDGTPSPASIQALSDEAMRAAGLSRGKVRYLRDLSQKVADGTVPLNDLAHLEDEAVIEVMTRVKGIGRWSAEMFLMFRLHRPDVMPVGDLGIVNAIRRAYGLRKTPTPKRMLQIAETWRPYRSIACWYLWHSLDSTPKQ
jgi:DNA-3-methyladenine glycosylase II